MKTIVIYTTKYGCAEKTAKAIKEQLQGEVYLCNIMKEEAPSIIDFDTVILGGSIYMGVIQKELKKFTNVHLEQLLDKNVGLFICAGQPNEEVLQKELKDAFPKALYDHAIVKEILGDAISFDKMNVLDKIVIRMVKKETNSYENIAYEKIEQFAGKLNSSES